MVGIPEPFPTPIKIAMVETEGSREIELVQGEINGVRRKSKRKRKRKIGRLRQRHRQRFKTHQTFT